MARGIKTGGKDIKPGEVLNPRGNAYPKELQRLDKWTQLTFRLRVQEFLNMTMADLSLFGMTILPTPLLSTT